MKILSILWVYTLHPMKSVRIILAAILVTGCVSGPSETDGPYLQNRAPLVPKRYIELPLGTVKPEGWLLGQLELMKEGMTGHLDTWYPEVVGDRNGWLGGDGDGWERGPYWLDGLVPLAWILDDGQLKAKATRWI